jgi:hypothetical protein
LNTNVVLAEIGYAGKTGTPWEKLFKVATGNLIITALGFVPGGSIVHLPNTHAYSKKATTLLCLPPRGSAARLFRLWDS